MRKSQISASMMCSNLVDLQATIDVFEKEPPLDTTHPLLNSKNTIVTPHVAFM